MTDNAILAATIHRDDDMAPSFTQSLLSMVTHDAVHDMRLVRGGGPLLYPATPMSMVAVRNKIVRYLLDESQADWLLLIDSDMGFAPDLADRLLEAADPVERPVVGALCFGLQKRETDGMGGWLTRPFPTLYDYRTDPDGAAGFRIRWDYTDNTVTRVSATGAAALLIHRDALAKLRAEHGDTWFDRVKLTADGDLLGEDMSFCSRLGAAGIPLHVHTGVKTTHQRSFWLREDDYLAARALSALQAGRPVATEAMSVAEELAR